MKVHVNSVFFGIFELLVKSDLWKICALIRGGTIPADVSERQRTSANASECQRTSVNQRMPVNGQRIPANVGERQ
jgi:hypothetical protein